jgi:ElaB/YqjD/DUF883 family membrane-anchored ribosome-binding protein
MRNERDATNGDGAAGRTSGYGNNYTGSSEQWQGETGGESGGMTGSSEIRNLIADVEDLLKGVANVGDADIARLRARVTETVQSAKSTLLDHTQNIRAQAGDAAAAADDYVRERPWAAIGIAAAIGVVVGLVAGRRGSSDY